MDKDKSEKLKEVLNRTLTTESIEEKLKKETEILAQKREQEKIKKEEENKKEQERIEKKKEEEVKKLQEEKTHKKIEKKEKPQKEVVIPTIRDKKKNDDESNLVLYLVAVIAILLLALTIYLFTKNDHIEKTTINTPKEIQINKDSEIKKSIEKQIEEKPLLAVALDEKKNKEEKEITQEKPLVKIEKEIQIVEKPVEVIKEVIKEKIVTKIVKLEKQNFKEYYNSKKYNTLKCYNFKAGDIFPNAKCKTSLKTFLKANKNALRFEIIPVIAEEDNKIFVKIQSKLKGMEQSFQDKVKEYMFRGLSRERVLETSWQVKDILGEDVVLTPTNYYVKSKKNNKGIIIKAYH